MRATLPHGPFVGHEGENFLKIKVVLSNFPYQVGVYLGSEISGKTRESNLSRGTRNTFVLFIVVFEKLGEPW